MVHLVHGSESLFNFSFQPFAREGSYEWVRRVGRPFAAHTSWVVTPHWPLLAPTRPLFLGAHPYSNPVDRRGGGEGGESVCDKWIHMSSLPSSFPPLGRRFRLLSFLGRGEETPLRVCAVVGPGQTAKKFFGSEGD